MKSWRFHEFGDIRNLRLEQVAVPKPGPGEVLVKVAYAALNPADAFLVKGQYPRPGRPPFAVGRDGSGVVVQSGPGADLGEGRQVVVLRGDTGVSRDGTLAEYVTVPAESLAMLPDGWTLQEGAAAPLVFLTAWQALVDVGGIEPGMMVLVTGASGGVGTAAVLLAKAFGCQVIALSRSVKKRAKLLKLGAMAALDSADPELAERAKEAMDGGRADIAVENLGGDYLQRCLDLVGPRGRIAVVGLLAGLSAKVKVPILIFKQARIEGVSVGGYGPAEAQAAWTGIVHRLNRIGARPLIDSVFPATGVQEAFSRLAEGPMGKVLVQFGE